MRAGFGSPAPVALSCLTRYGPSQNVTLADQKPTPLASPATLNNLVEHGLLELVDLPVNRRD